MRTRRLSSTACLASLLALTACGGGGGGGTDTPEATALMTVDTVTVSGSAAWPGASVVEVAIDGSTVPVVDGQWTATVAVSDGSEQRTEVAIIADGTVVAINDVLISPTSP